MAGPKLIRWAPKPVPDSFAAFMELKCDECGARLADDMRAGYRYEDTDMGDYIERRDVESLCGGCMRECTTTATRALAQGDQ